MVSRHLITTADERTWPEKKEKPVLFLGEWCRLHNRKCIWEKLDAKIVPYHWDNREKLRKDYQYLNEIYEEKLIEITIILNKLNGIDRSARYWRILVGPWLGYFIQILFDRWSMIEYAVKSYQIAGVYILRSPKDLIVPNDMAHFNRLYVEDQWNEAIYGQLIKESGIVQVEEVVNDNKNRYLDSELQKLKLGRLVKRKIKATISNILDICSKSDDAFLISDYLPIGQKILLQWRLDQIPKHWSTIETPKSKVEWSQRKWSIGEERKGSFLSVLGKMIPLHIPTIYLEGYKVLQKQLEKLRWPKHPRVIFTSNSHFSDDIFKAWAGEKVDAGTPLVVGQHGGHYGIGLWSFSEDHETKICDSYLSWGWKEDKKPKVIPVGQLKAKTPIGSRHEKKTFALLVTATVPRYSYWMYSIIVSSQWLYYFNDQIRFVEKLPDNIKYALIIRLHPKDYSWKQIDRWREKYPNLCMDDGMSDIKKLIRQSCLFISTYNATTFLESFTMNVPTVIYWNPKYWEIRESSVVYFEELKRVGIFHESPESAAKHVSTVWGNVGSWWYSQEVQFVREKFCNKYAYLPKDLIKRVEIALRKTIYQKQKSRDREKTR